MKKGPEAELIQPENLQSCVRALREDWDSKNGLDFDFVKLLSPHVFVWGVCTYQMFLKDRGGIYRSALFYKN